MTTSGLSVVTVRDEGGTLHLQFIVSVFAEMALVKLSCIGRVFVQLFSVKFIVA